MAYTPNPTWADGSAGGTPITAAKLNNMEAGIEDADNRITALAAAAVPAARVFHSANQAIGTASATVLAFNSERFDTDTIHDNATNNSRLTCKTAGKYLITGTIEWPVAATGTRGAYLRVNGGTFVGIAQHPPSNTGVDVVIVTTLWEMAVNDYVELLAFQSSGGNLNVNASASYSPEFSMVKVA